MECAMFAAGVRSAATRPAMPRRELKKLQKAAKANGAERDERATEEEAQPEPSAAAATSEAPPAPATDWDRPWWEEREVALAD
jgi:hypothetical protein